MDDINNKVVLDNVNAGNGESKVDLCDLYSGGSDCSDDGGLDDVGGVDTNDADDGDCGDGDSKVNCGDDLDGSDVDDVGGVGSNIG